MSETAIRSDGNRRLLALVRQIVSILTFAGLVGLGWWYYTRRSDDFRLITAVSAQAVIVLVALKLITMLLFGVQLKILTDSYNLKLSFSKWFGLSRMGRFINLFVPFAGGASLKAVYLRKFHNFGYSSFVASTAVGNIVRLMVTALFAATLLLFSGHPGRSMFAITGMIFLGTSIPLVLAQRMEAFSGFLPNLALPLAREWQTIGTNHKVIAKLVLLSCLMYGVSTLEVFFSFKAFSAKSSIVESGVISAFMTFLAVFKLVPANLGLKEAVFMGISNSYGTGLNEALHAAALHRIIGMVCTLILTPGFAFSLSRETGEK